MSPPSPPRTGDTVTRNTLKDTPRVNGTSAALHGGMKKTGTKVLKLETQTVRSLRSTELRTVNGGMPMTCYNCPPPHDTLCSVTL
jgi:hypothetical protein